MLTAPLLTVRLVVPILALVSTMLWAQAAPRTVSVSEQRPVAFAITVENSGNATMSGAFVESDYVAPHGKPDAGRSALGLIEAEHGRDSFNEAIVYLRQSARARVLLDRINRSGSRISIVINRRCEGGQHMGAWLNAVINWDPTCAYHTGTSTNSPALVLMHELVHSLHLAEDPQAFLDNSVKPDRRFDTAEEHLTIVYGEIPIARELGEGIRTDHHENRPFRVYDPTVR